MYPYHNMIKKRIKNGELVGYEFVKNYKNIGECLLLYFNTQPFERPIRPYKYSEYAEFFADLLKSENKQSSILFDKQKVQKIVERLNGDVSFGIKYTKAKPANR